MTVTIKWLGHASFQIRTDTKIIYVDLEASSKPDENADIIISSHSHGDHCHPGKINEVRKDDSIVIAPADCVAKIGGTVQSLKPGEETTIDDISIKAVHAYNEKRFRSPNVPFHPKGLGVGYIVSVEGKRIYHAGDTDFIQEMKDLGPIDVALLPTGGKYTMESDDGADAAIAINPKASIPMHTWDGKHGSFPADFKKKVEAHSDIQVILLKTGEEYTVPRNTRGTIQ